jgi:hypothetical protein
VTETGWVPDFVPPNVARRMRLDQVQDDHETRLAEKAEADAAAQRAEHDLNTAVTTYLEAATARGEYVNPAQAAAAALPATDAERDQRIRAALQFAIDGFHDQWQGEYAKLEALASAQAEFGPVLGQDGQKTHVFVGEARIQSPAPAARSRIGLEIFHRARRFREARRAAEAAAAAADASANDWGILDLDYNDRSGWDRPRSSRSAAPSRDERVRFGGPITGVF